VKPFIPQPRGEGMSYAFAPHFPLTMRDLNNAVPDGVSDHAPITVDLPLSDPPWQPNLVGSPGRYPHALSGLYKLERDKNADSITLLLAKSHRQAEPMDR
jgi:hypothetical protein